LYQVHQGQLFVKIMSIPKILHRIWLGSIPTYDQLLNLVSARQNIERGAELRLWASRSIVSKLLKDSRIVRNGNIVVCDIDHIWKNNFNGTLPLIHLQSAFERENRGYLHNYAAASDIARLLILYIYGGVYLDMDIEFKDSVRSLFVDLDGIGQRLGVLITKRGEGNGVLASMPRIAALSKCLNSIAQLYNATENHYASWYAKRVFGDWRMLLTMEMTGPRRITFDLEPDYKLLFPIKNTDYFKKINATGESFCTPPKIQRHDSQPIIDTDAERRFQNDIETNRWT
jgi:Glycosyltransferase sugar-binding region containing DXD motif